MGPSTRQNYRDLFVGLETKVPLLDGSSTTYANLDNAASTPAFASVLKGLNSFLEYYASVHRGTGFKSQLSTWAYETAREKVLAFVGARPSSHVCIFGKNTTEAINKLAHRLPRDRDLILVSTMEHHSNDLPFRAVGKVIHVGLTPEGMLDEEAFDRALKEWGPRTRLIAISGASNVTGTINPVHRLAEKAHAVGAPILVDCAQLAAHRAIRVGEPGDPSSLDFVALSAHKMYAPFGCGALVARRGVFEVGDPDYSGGGTVEIVTVDDVAWAHPPERDEAGSPNVSGAVALGLAIQQLEAIGMEAVAAHEAELTAYALERLRDVPQVKIYGDRDPLHAADRLGVIPFSVSGKSHFLVASILGHEFAIGVRSGCFCAHPYVLHLLGLSETEAATVRARILAGDRSEMPGMVRISLGLYNTFEEIDRLLMALERICKDSYSGHYVQTKATGEFAPEGWQPDYSRFFSMG
jgi:selenocysteine lyase/cysteine desulfurase